jgi:pimeloyl-ACP methyl ester carboxylesterase
MVIWLWKSEKELTRLYRDFRVHSKRAAKIAPALKATLERLGDARVALVGFSLGTQVILSTLDSMEEARRMGSRAGEHPSVQIDWDENHSGDNKYRVALIAPALDPAYACDVANRTVASSVTATTRVFNNRSDRAVKALRIILRRECPSKSISFGKLTQERRLNIGQVKNIDLTAEAGFKHSIVNYSFTKSLCCELGEMLSEVAGNEILANQPVPHNQFAVE